MSTTAIDVNQGQTREHEGLALRMACLPASVVGLYFLARPWPADTWAVYVLWTCFTAYSMFCWTNCFHETGHQMLTRWRWLDLVIGRLLGTLMFLPYTVYREAHIRHHASMNRPNDWELWPYVSPKCFRTFRRVFVFFDILFGFIVTPFIFSRIFFHADSPLMKPAMRRTIWFEYLGIVLFWGFVGGGLTYAGAWPALVTVWLVPHMIAGVMQTIRRLTEHLGMGSYEPLFGTRTVIGGNWITRLSSYVNFDIFMHGLHHRHPRLERDRLQEKMEDYIRKNPEVNYPVYSRYWQAMMAMLPCLLRNPGIGVNAGAAPLSQAPNPDFTSFPAEVVGDVS